MHLDNAGGWLLLTEVNGESNPTAVLLIVQLFTQEVSCIGFEQRNASFLTSVGFSPDKESWFGVLSLS